MPTSRVIPREVDLLAAGISSIRRTVYKILKDVAEDPRALDRFWSEELKKFCLRVDIIAQQEGMGVLRASLPNQLELRGEETTLKPVPPGRVAALLDMLDGSDLLERGLGNWCSALVIFDPLRTKIVTSVIGLPNREIYYATESKDGAFVMLPKLGEHHQRIVYPVRMQNRRVQLKDASLAFYGQQAGGLLSVGNGPPKFTKWLDSVARLTTTRRKSRHRPRLRIYNLAGNPMMLKLVEGKVDAVFETRGQLCHDVIPGAFIALKAGAVLRDLRNRTITPYQLAKMLRKPEQRLQYVLANSNSLARELVNLLDQDAQ